MKRSFFLILPTLLTLGACGGSSAPVSTESLDGKLKAGKELADFGDVEVHQGYLDLLTRVNPNIEGQVKTPAGKKRLVDSLLEQELLYKESIKRGIPALAQVQEKAALYQRVIYGQALVDEEINKKSKEYYDQNKDKEFSRVKVAHILIRPKPAVPEKGAKTPPDNSANEADALKKAQEAKAKLANGAQWSDVVMEYSMDVATKSKNGDLGYLSRGDRRGARLDWNELIEKSFTMKIGEVSDPIKAKDGYHIITVEEVAGVAPFDEVANSIKFKLRSQVKSEILASLTKGAKIEYKDEELSNAGSAPAAPSMFQAPGGGAPGAAPGAPGGASLQIQTKPAAPGAPTAAVKPAAPAPAAKTKAASKPEPK